MSDRYAFDQELVYANATNRFARSDSWSKFTKLHRELGFKVRITGGVFLTHEIDGTKEDFETILDLIEY
jgi:hypothetical protein